MGLMDGLQNSGNMDDMMSKFNELRSKEQAGELDERGREELNNLRQKLGK